MLTKHVGPQIGLLHSPIVTVLAFEGFLASVDHPVPPEVRLGHPDGGHAEGTVVLVVACFVLVQVDAVRWYLLVRWYSNASTRLLWWLLVASLCRWYW